MTSVGERSAQERLESVRRRVVAVIGHALRTPTTTIRGLAEVIAKQDGQIPSAVTDALTRETRMLERLVDDLLVASDITAVLPVQAPQPHDVGGVAQAAWERIAAEHDERVNPSGPVLADRQLHVDRDGVVFLGRDTLEWILENVLRNAIAYADGAVRIAVEGQEGRARITVRAEEARGSQTDAENALELFYRGEDAVTSISGFGIGLPVAQRLARHAGGELAVSRDGETFVVEIDLPTQP